MIVYLLSSIISNISSLFNFSFLSLSLQSYKIFLYVQNDFPTTSKVSYREGFNKALEQSSFVSILLWAIGILIALLLIFFLTVLLKKQIEKKIRSIDIYSMSYNDIEKMKRTGLISDEEMAVVRRKITLNFMEKGKKEADNIEKQKFVMSDIDTEKARMLEISAKELNIEQKITPPISRTSAPPKIKVERPGLKEINLSAEDSKSFAHSLVPKKRDKITPLNLKLMLQEGLINESEYQDLSEFFKSLKCNPSVNFNREEEKKN